MTEISSPGETLVFADTAMVKDRKSFIEYSFAEPPFTVHGGRPVTEFYMSPSNHFRHAGQANVGWADGHIEPRRMAKSDRANAYGVDSAQKRLGWFEPVNNTLFDLE
jgi:prepilin-type processing-associated H-X9-DG protein